jgi:N-glycosylase/DNA lyase
MKRGKIKSDYIVNLDHTFSSGQIFRWYSLNKGWIGVAYSSIIYLRQISDKIIEYKISGKLEKEGLEEFLGLDDDYSEIFENDTLEKIYKRYVGLKLLKQNKWECAISYICSSYNNIKRINKIIENLSVLSRRKLKLGDIIMYDFPSSEQLKKYNEKDFLKLGLGFRSSYLVDFCNKINEEILEEFEKEKTETIKKFLMNIKGVGNKISDCILLYSFKRLECFPIDIWVARALLKLFNKELKEFLKEINIQSIFKKYNEISLYFNKRYNNKSGYVQLLLYKYIRDVK